MTDEQLDHFNFYRNIGNSVTVDQVVADYNAENPDAHITPDDVRFGPSFNDEFGPAPASQRRNLSFVYNSHGSYTTDTGRDLKSPQSVFVREAEPRDDNLGEVIGRIEEENYIDHFGVRTSKRNEYEGFPANVDACVAAAVKEQGWGIESIDDGRRAAVGPRYLIFIEGTAYMLKQAAFPPRIAVYDGEGDRLEEETDGVKAILSAVGAKLNADISAQEKDFDDHYGEIND